PNIFTESNTGPGGVGGGVLLLVSFLHEIPTRNKTKNVNTAFFVFRKPTIFSILFLLRLLLIFFQLVTVSCIYFRSIRPEMV
ncbi:MAG TPA: hypothetical protein VGH64_17390, partial [Puia sp.]